MRSAMHAAIQLHGRGPLMWILPLYLYIKKKSDDDDDDDDMFVKYLIIPNEQKL